MKFIKNNDEVFGGKVKDHWWRIEFQNLGSPHLHMVIWIENHPEFDTEEGKLLLDRNCCCEMPTEGEDPELYELVKKCQIHRHTHTCMKNNTLVRCRFNFPRQECDDTRIVSHSPDDFLRNGGRICLLKRRKEDAWVNNYHPEFIRLWSGNMDIQPCGSNEAIAYYIAKYLPKAEPEGVDSGIAQAIQQIQREETDISRKLFRICMKILHERQVSAAECAYRLCHIPLRDSSRNCIFLNTRKPEQRYRVLQSDRSGHAITVHAFEILEQPEIINPEAEEEELPDTEMSNDQFQRAQQAMNIDQRQLFVLITESIENQLNGDVGREKIFLTGGAGTGKTFLFNLLKNQVNRCYGKSVVKVGALNGVAARASCGNMCWLQEVFLYIWYSKVVEGNSTENKIAGMNDDSDNVSTNPQHLMETLLPPRKIMRQKFRCHLLKWYSVMEKNDTYETMNNFKNTTSVSEEQTPVSISDESQRETMNDTQNMTSGRGEQTPASISDKIQQDIRPKLKVLQNVILHSTEEKFGTNVMQEKKRIKIEVRKFVENVKANFKSQINKFVLIELLGLSKYAKLFTNIGVIGDKNKLVEVSQRKSRIWNEKDRCVYCDRDCTNFSRHLFRNHENEDSVRKIMQLPKGNKERRRMINILRKEGNLTLLDENKIRPVQRATRKYEEGQENSAEAIEFMPCPYC
ncbi:hypothetical protein JTB14_029204 [Gonioctena quinquepunctata]|nr:hypothetical protein JTB14_029204 [Gonioctena quinquepunctata]